MDHDPWDWDADEVVAFFREHAADTLPESQRSRLPSSDDFFELLQNEGVNGECLLTAVDTSALRDEYGITSAMSRTAVWSCICKLRVRSVGYATQHGLPVFATQTPRSLPPNELLETPISQARESTSVTTSAEETFPDARPGGHAHSAALQVQNAASRKRRKLDSSKLQTTAKTETLTKKGKTYLPPATVSVDEIFYGSTGYGEEIGELPPNGTIMVPEADRDDGLQDNDFQFQRHEKAMGEIEFVYKNMLHMLKDAEVYAMRRQGHDALVLHPYRQAPSKVRSATVIQFTNRNHEHPVALKESAAYLKSTAPEKHAAAGGEWEFLMEKYAAGDDQILPGYGDSETVLSESRPTVEESDSDSMAEESLATDELGNERVSEIIDEILEEQHTSFHERVPKLEEKKAYSVWKMTKGSRTIRAELIQSAQLHIDHLHDRLRKQKEQLLQSQWASVDSLKKVCRSLETTVEDIEYEHWRIQVWGRKQEPWHAKRISKGVARSDHDHQTKPGDAASIRLFIPENDRLSISPPPQGPDDTCGTVAETDGPAQNRDNLYEGDDEAFHTPATTPEPQQGSTDANAGADDPNDPTFIVEDEVILQEDAPDGHAEIEEAGPPAVQPSPSGKNSPYMPAVGSDVASNDLPSPSIFKANKLKHLPSTPSSKRTMSIDLTGDSPSSLAHTSPSRKGETVPRTKSVTDDPYNASAEEIDSWSFHELIKARDRRRVLLKILRDAGASKRDELHKCYLSLQRPAFVKQLKDKLVQMRNENIDSLNDDVGDVLRLAAGIYLHWHLPTLLTTASPADIEWTSALQHVQISAFSGMLDAQLMKKDTARFNSANERSPAAPGSSSANAMILSSDNEMPSSSKQSSRKKRKRPVEQSQTASDNRQKAFQRMQRAELAESQSAANSSQLAAMIDTDPTNSSVQINSLKGDDQPEIYVASKIASKMKEHQINGARFLWREITATDDDGGRGCVLAHTMGLGKTMQTIALLAALNEAALSKRKAVRLQVPKHLRPKEMRGAGTARNLRVIILCPAGLIQNWNHEIKTWVGKKIGHVFCLESSVKPASRPPMISDWMRMGGVLILGYEMFRSLVNYSSDKRTKSALIDEDHMAEVLKNLIDGPQLVVADEAHNLKNEKSGIGTAVKQFKTESRIALTGTPMSNDVQEIYALVSWISPDYLGDPTDFRANFAEPIKEGLYAESTVGERRKSIMKLQVLHREIRPKVNRANIEALRGSIPGKVEFVIFVSLQELQIELYRKYIRAVKAFIDPEKREDGTQETSQVVFMSMLSVLTLLTGHPCCFRDKLLEPPKEKKSKTDKDGEADNVETESDPGGKTPNTASGSATHLATDITTAQEVLDKAADKAVDTHVSAQGLTPETVSEILGGDGSDITSEPGLSSKITIFLHLLRRCLAVKDRSIVFSQRLGMLDYLGQLLEAQRIEFGRIDGSNMSKRMTLLEQFDSGNFAVMLVSTKAGGVGLNMQCANRVFIFDSGFNPTYEEQAIGRAYRLGQKKPVYVYRFVAAGTFETNIYNKQLFKTSLAQRVVDKKNPRRTAERSTRDYLYEPKEPIQANITEHIGKDPQVLGKLLSQHGTGGGKFDTMIRDVKTMETLTEEIMDEPLTVEEQQKVEEETEARKQRPRGRHAVGPGLLPTMNGAAPSSTMPPPGFFPPPPPPPPSTYAGPSGGLKPHRLGGLPST